MSNTTSSTVNRRKFLRGAAIGGAALGIAAAVPHRLSSAGPWKGRATRGSASSLDPQQPMVAYVRDASRGELVVMFGTREIVLKDPDLAAYLTEMSRTA